MDRKGGSLALAVAVDIDSSGVLFDEMADNGQAEAQPALAVRGGVVCLFVTVKNLRQKFFADADAGVCYHKPRIAVFLYKRD
jgi:hypothetical protein